MCERERESEKKMEKGIRGEGVWHVRNGELGESVTFAGDRSHM